MIPKKKTKKQETSTKTQVNLASGWRPQFVAWLATYASPYQLVIKICIYCIHIHLIDCSCINYFRTEVPIMIMIVWELVALTDFLK